MRECETKKFVTLNGELANWLEIFRQHAEHNVIYSLVAQDVTVRSHRLSRISLLVSLLTNTILSAMPLGLANFQHFQVSL